MIIKIDADFADIVPGFLSKRHEEMLVLWEALQKGDFATLKSIGHRLKGNAGGYGFDHMGFIGAEIETAAIIKDAPKIEQALKALDEYLKNIEIVYVD